MIRNHPLLVVLAEARACTACASALPLGPRPLLAAHPESRILIMGQAPGRTTHKAGTPWLDPSGDRLRQWLGVTAEEFYDERRFAFVPTGFCYPGSGATGDLPPRKECSPLWHPRILPLMVATQLTITIGAFAFTAAFGKQYENLSAAAANFGSLLPEQIVLPHPSPRNRMWAKTRPWFEAELLPSLRERVSSVLASRK